MEAVSFLLEICGSVLAITRTASCACSAGASTSKPAQLAARSHTLNTRIIRRARALTDFQAEKKRQFTVYKDYKTYFFNATFCNPVDERHPFLYTIQMFKGRFL